MLPIFHNQALCKPETAGDYIKTQWAPDATTARYDWIYQYDAATAPLH
jgi:salicylate hydroxylase